MENTIVAKFGGSSLANSNQFAKVRDIIKADNRRKYIIPSAPGKVNKGDHKVTDLLYMCYQLASHNLNIDEVFSIIERRFLGICQELELTIEMEEILTHIKRQIQSGSSKDYAASRGEYLNSIILSNYLGFEFIDAKDLIIFNEKGEFDSNITRERIQNRLKDSSGGH